MITILCPGGQRAGPMAVADAEVLFGARMAQTTEEGGNLQLDQLIEVRSGQLGNQLHSGAAIE
jgi:hypothetical protein